MEFTVSNRRKVVAGLAALTALSLGVSGCTDDKKTGAAAPAASTGAGATAAPGATAAAPADPKAALAASTAGLQQGTYTFTLKADQLDAKGVMNLPAKAASLDTVQTGEDDAGTRQYLIVDPDRYVKMKVDVGDAAGELDSLGADGADPQTARLTKSLKGMADLYSGKNWHHLELAKLTDKSDFPLSVDHPDATGATTLLAGVKTAESTGATITGKLDASKLTEGGPFDPDEVADLGAKAKDLAYVATLDAQGRLSSLVLDVPKSGDTPAGKRTITVAGYGIATAPQKPPAAEVKELPEDSYGLISG
jgi:hypothetical protein